MSDDRPPVPPPSSEPPPSGRARPPRIDEAPSEAPAAQNGGRPDRRRTPRGLALLAVLPGDLDDPVWDPVDPKLGAKHSRRWTSGCPT